MKAIIAGKRTRRTKGCKKAKRGAGCRRCRSGKRRRLLRAAVFYYYALGDGRKFEFTLEDAMPGYESSLPDPRRISLINVFVDGMLQSPSVYRVEPGMLRFATRQPPPEEARIIVQFVVMAYRKTAPRSKG